MLYNTAAAFYLRDFVSELSDFCIVARCTESSRGWCGGRGRLRAARLVRTSACLFDLLSAGIAGPGLSVLPSKCDTCADHSFLVQRGGAAGEAM